MRIVFVSYRNRFVGPSFSRWDSRCIPGFSRTPRLPISLPRRWKTKPKLMVVSLVPMAKYGQPACGSCFQRALAFFMIDNRLSRFGKDAPAKTGVSQLLCCAQGSTLL